jgi:hypothetical protein
VLPCSGCDCLADPHRQILTSLVDMQVSHIQQNTKIPVLGHADGICHIYVDEVPEALQAAHRSFCSPGCHPADHLVLSATAGARRTCSSLGNVL